MWGEDSTGVAERQEKFLYEQVPEVRAKLKQSIIKPITGLEWFCRQILKEVTGRVVDISLELEGVAVKRRSYGQSKMSWIEWNRK